MASIRFSGSYVVACYLCYKSLLVHILQVMSNYVGKGKRQSPNANISSSRPSGKKNTTGAKQQVAGAPTAGIPNSAGKKTKSIVETSITNKPSTTPTSVDDPNRQANRQLILSKFITSEQGSHPTPIVSYVASGTSSTPQNLNYAAAANQQTDISESQLIFPRSSNEAMLTAGQYQYQQQQLRQQQQQQQQKPVTISQKSSQTVEQSQQHQSQLPVDALCPAVRRMGYAASSMNVVGEGAFSRVYRARSDRIPDRDICVKIVRVDDVNIPQAWKEYSMKRELKILKKVRHPNVITIYDVIKTRTRIYIFMDLAAASVSSHLEATEEPASEQTARNWFGGISNAIAYLHKIEIAHRDLKNENILIDSQGQAKLTDFGFACFTYDRRTKSDLLSNTSCGTKAYVAPEVFNPPYNAKYADVWSLGVCLYECVTLLQPFRDDLPNQIFIRRQIEKGLVIPRRLQLKISDLLQDLLHKMIEPDVNKRIHSEAILVHPWIQMPRA